MSAVILALFMVLGLVAGVIHFAALASEAACLVGDGPAWRLIGLRLGRLALTIAVLVFACLHGWPALLASAAAFLGGRTIVMRRHGDLR